MRLVFKLLYLTTAICLTGTWAEAQLSWPQKFQFTVKSSSIQVYDFPVCSGGGLSVDYMACEGRHGVFGEYLYATKRSQLNSGTYEQRVSDLVFGITLAKGRLLHLQAGFRSLALKSSWANACVGPISTSVLMQGVVIRQTLYPTARLGLTASFSIAENIYPNSGYRMREAFVGPVFKLSQNYMACTGYTIKKFYQPSYYTPSILYQGIGLIGEATVANSLFARVRLDHSWKSYSVPLPDLWSSWNIGSEYDPTQRRTANEVSVSIGYRQ